MTRPRQDASGELADTVLSVRLTPSLSAAVDAMARRWDLPRAGAVVRLIRAQAEHDAKRVVEPRLKGKP